MIVLIFLLMNMFFMEVIQGRFRFYWIPAVM